MTNKHTRSKYKGIKWIRTRYARGYRLRILADRSQKAMIMIQGLCAINTIRAAKAFGDFDKAAKAAAIAQQYAQTFGAVIAHQKADPFGIRCPQPRKPL